MHDATRSPSPCLAALAAIGLALPAGAQVVYVNAPGNVPQGSPANSSATEQVDFADVDLDGDWDAAFADGGDLGNDQNRLWINLGGLQGGAVGFFVDETAARLPSYADQSRDVEFADIDGDGDPDLLGVNTASIVNQGARWWVNQGGVQGGAAGFYSDETTARWVGLGGPGSSIPPAAVLASGGWIHWAQEHAFADVDGDGDLDLVTAAVGSAFGGQEPTRVFLNDGAGFFDELNPSGVQLPSLTISNGDPGLWCQGLQQASTTNTTGAFCDVAAIGIAVDVADVDADLDLDLLLLDRIESPRLYRNLSELGTTVYRDATGLAFPQGWGGGSAKYEQDLGDLDGDADLDLYGVNWGGLFLDATLRGAGDGTWSEPTGVGGTVSDGEDADFLDFDADGDLDVLLASFSGDEQLLRNDYAGGPLVLTVQPGAVTGTPVETLRDVEVADLDLDGDPDAMEAGDQANLLLVDVLDLPDATPPRVPLLEQPPDQPAGGGPLRLRAHVLDNAPDYLTAHAAVQLAYWVDGGAPAIVPMRWAGGQVFHGELPLSAAGLVTYRVRAIDAVGNVGLSAAKSVHTAGGCSGSASTYCVGKPTSEGCVPAMSFDGAPSASAGSGFVLRASALVSGVNGLFFYSTSGAAALPFQGGLLCIAPPVTRMPVANSGGAAPCSGTLQLDFNAWIASGVDPALGPGAQVWLQCWTRDPASPVPTSLSDALRFTVCP